MLSSPVYAELNPRHASSVFSALSVSSALSPVLIPSLQRFNGPAPERHSSALESSPYQSVTLSPTKRPPKSFSSNTYGPPHKCCKQKTYGKPNSFICNTYKKPGGAASTARSEHLGEGCTLSFTPFHQIPAAPVFSYTYKLPIFYPLCFDIHPCNGGGVPPRPTLELIA
jgi:hypothetical protein